MKWTERAHLLVDLLADPTDRRTKREKSIAAGYCETEVFRFQREPEFREAVLERARELIGSNLAAVYNALYRITVSGSDRDAIKAADVLLKALGEIQTGARQQVNVTQTAPPPPGFPSDFHVWPFEERLRWLEEKREREYNAKPVSLEERLTMDETQKGANDAEE